MSVGWQARGDDADPDNDGLLDGNDQCPFDPGPLYTEGCPDFDNDGLADRIDECPDVRGPERSFGCPDMDSDEVPDYRDDCPETPDHADADPLRSDGCPGLAWPSGQRIELTDQVRFDFGRATIRPESLPTLNAVARILKRNDDIRLLEVAGHTDNVGGAAANLRLSRLRAAAVRQYLISQGVESSRLIAKGYGETLPVDTNLTDPGRFFNRRVEFLIERSTSSATD
jgi:outer membrane protein OmpA-like peptidoglycan-associated protein